MVEEPWQYGRSLDDDVISDSGSYLGYLGIEVHTMRPYFRQLHQSVLLE